MIVTKRQRLSASILLACLAAFGCEESAPAARAPASPSESVNGDASSKDRLVDKTFDDIKFEMALEETYHESMLTDAIRALDGQRLRLRGYILPTAQKRGIKQFVLVRDNLECCFGPGAALYDCVFVEMQGDASAEFSIRPVAVEGRFALSEFPGPDGKPLAIYRIAGETVK